MFLYIIRHATAEDKIIWPHDYLRGGKDYARKLIPKWEKQAKRSGKALKKLKIIPDLIISSPAPRALETASIIAKEIWYDYKDIQQQPILWDATQKTMLTDFKNALSNRAPTESTLFFIWHNESIYYFQRYLSEIDLPIPKACIVGLEFNIENRANIHKWSGKLMFYFAP